jgi:N-acetylglucosamine-6-sulfatase
MPTVLAAAGLESPSGIDGQSFLPVLQGKNTTWRDTLLYEYYWERNFPQTPTMHALRGERFKYIRYHGIWDLNELYDLKEDPRETTNLINDPKHAATVKDLNAKLFDFLEKTNGLSMPLYPDRGTASDKRHPTRSKTAPFPDDFFTGNKTRPPD